MNETRNDTVKLLGESQQKYIYFLMAVAASAITLCIKRTTGCPISISMIPLGIAVISWAISFAYGCYNRAYYCSTLHANCALLEVEGGAYPEIGNHPQTRVLEMQ